MADRELTFEQVQGIVAATIRQVAEWGPMPGDELHRVADDVTQARPDDGVCPTCEEVTCDEGCPFEGTRFA